MPRKKPEKSPLQELADKADMALALCWKRLGAEELERADITKMVEAWRTKRRAHLEAEETKQLKKEERESGE